MTPSALTKTDTHTLSQNEVKRLAEQQNKLQAWRRVLETVEQNEGASVIRLRGRLMEWLVGLLISLIPRSPYPPVLKPPLSPNPNTISPRPFHTELAAALKKALGNTPSQNNSGNGGNDEEEEDEEETRRRVKTEAPGPVELPDLEAILGAKVRMCVLVGVGDDGWVGGVCRTFTRPAVYNCHPIPSNQIPTP